MRRCTAIENGRRRKGIDGPAQSATGRIALLKLAFFLGGGAILLRLFFLQVAAHEKWVALAEDQHIADIPISADRGEIFMQDGGEPYPLAVNREYMLLYVEPQNVVEKEKTAIALNGIVGVEVQTILDKLNLEGDPFEIIQKRLTDEQVAKVKELDLPGVGLLPEKYRYYPGGELASQVVGYATLQDKAGGGYGIEAAQNELLAGADGRVEQEKDAAGRWIPLSDRHMDSAEHGSDIILTIDRAIQFETEKILKESVEKYEADSASAIVMDPHTGKVLAMAAFPQFNPNEYSKVEDYSLFLNPSLSLTYEPGSIMKPITMAIGIEDGKVSPDTEYTDPGVISIGGYDIRNAEDKSYGRSSMYKVLDESINTGVIFVERLVGNAAFRDYIHRFGFGAKTGIELPAELPGNVRNLENTRSDIQFYTASFGQGIAATPLQMAAAYAALANGGTLMKPQIIDRIIHPDGRVEQKEPEKVRQVLSPETTAAMGKMLRSVVVNGHGKRADVPGYLVGGKTGTAQVAKGNGGGYEEGMSIGSFAGYAPVNDPKFVVIVKLDNPKAVEWAESSAAPAFGEIMRFLLEYANIKPTESTEQK